MSLGGFQKRPQTEHPELELGNFIMLRMAQQKDKRSLDLKMSCSFHTNSSPLTIKFLLCERIDVLTQYSNLSIQQPNAFPKRNVYQYGLCTSKRQVQNVAFSQIYLIIKTFGGKINDYHFVSICVVQHPQNSLELLV